MDTPSNIQSSHGLANRRLFFFALVAFTWVILMAMAWNVLGAQGWTGVDIIYMICFAIGTPWAVLGFWNALIGLWFLHFKENGLNHVAPYLSAGDVNEKITLKTAIFMTLRNEDPSRALKRLKLVYKSVEATGEGAQFKFFVLSDTNKPEIAAQEEQIIKQLEKEGNPFTYRRRTNNEGYKAGNVRDFCALYGKDYDLMLPLDADSLMDGETIIKMTRICQKYEKIGILQSLVVGLPSTSAFARMFQFGMRHGMRSYTFGQSWWVGDCGPFWGHNALVRIKPFYEQCHLPIIGGSPPLGGHILSHDQVEATLMRKAGFECRIYPIESGSYEENPPGIIPFMARDVRWCQGNLQYIALLDLKGLLPVSRFQLLWAILMFIGVPAWTLMIALLPIKLIDGESWQGFPATLAIITYITYLTMYLMPKFAGIIDIFMKENETDRYRGRRLFVKSALTELIFSFLLGAVATFRITIFMIGLLFGKAISWSGQQRDTEALSWGEAFDHLKWQTLFGFIILTPLFLYAPKVFLWSLPLTLGFIVSIPMAVFTASPKVGSWFVNYGLCGVPEDFKEPEIVTALNKE